MMIPLGLMSRFEAVAADAGSAASAAGCPRENDRRSNYDRTMTAAQVSVIGSGAEYEEAAEEVGRLLAERGCTLVCGGRGEVMAAAARGAKSAGGTTIGILPGETRADANQWIDHVVVTGIGHARNLAVAASGDAVIAVGGRYGTLAEIGFALTLGRRVVVLEPGWDVDGALRARTPREAVDLALAGGPPGN
jgi:hypothetical protein